MTGSATELAVFTAGHPPTALGCPFRRTRVYAVMGLEGIGVSGSILIGFVAAVAGLFGGTLQEQAVAHRIRPDDEKENRK